MQHRKDPRIRDSRHLVLHADKFSGKNKNRCALWNCSCLVCSGMYNSVRLQFLVAGHTKHIFDRMFGHFKRRFRSINVLTPREMIQCINDRAKRTSSRSRPLFLPPNITNSTSAFELKELLLWESIALQVLWNIFVYCKTGQTGAGV